MPALLNEEQFRQPTLQAFVEKYDANQDANKYPLAAAFPTTPVEEISVVYNLVKQSLTTAAAITGLNAAAPIKSLGEAQQAMTRLTKIQDSFFVDEEMAHKFFNPRTSAERQAIADEVFKNTAKLSDSVEVTKELIRAQLTYTGGLDYADPRTETKLSFKLERPQENDITVAQAWGEEASEPITDLLAAIEQFRKTNGNNKPEVISMNSATYAKLKRSGQIKTELFGSSNAARIVKDTEFNDLLASVGLPQIQIDDNETPIETLTGEQIVYKHIPDGRVVLRASVLGETLSGPSVENNWAKGKFVTTVSNLDPYREKTIVGEVGMPIVKDLNGTVFLDVLPQA